MDSPGLEISALETKLKALYLKRHKQQRLPSTPLLKRINRELAMHHNDENYEMEYIRKRFDYRCPVETLPLPRGKACHLQYKSNVERLHASMQSLLAEVDTKRQELLQALKESDKTEGVQDVILSELNATLDKYHQVQAELYHFLEKTEPIDVEAFHARLGPLLQEKLRIMRESRMAQIQTLQEAKADGVSSEASTIQVYIDAGQ